MMSQEVFKGAAIEQLLFVLTTNMSESQLVDIRRIVEKMIRVWGEMGKHVALLRVLSNVL